MKLDINYITLNDILSPFIFSIQILRDFSRFHISELLSYWHQIGTNRKKGPLEILFCGIGPQKGPLPNTYTLQCKKTLKNDFQSQKNEF